jgi:hypothetical protein
MTYFIRKDQQVGSCYHEFYKGAWDGRSFWSGDSILLHDDVMAGGFEEAIREVIPAYDPCGVTEISVSQWRDIGRRVLRKDVPSQEQYKEADDWLAGVFQEHPCFTILGI